MKWFFPSWNGDHRLEPHPKNPSHTLLIIQRPTYDEGRLLDFLGQTMLENGWVDSWKKVEKSRSFLSKKIHVKAPLEKVGPLFVWAFKPGPAVLTTVSYTNGSVITCSVGSLSEGPRALMELSEKIAKDAEKPDEPKPNAAVTVRRPTPSCPDCIPGAVGPASEVLLSFLSPEEHESWARERVIYVEGGLSGTMYRIAHRHSPLAREQRRICFDLDSDMVVHFHDTSVPPEEEVLAAKLILEHREPWLRNEATMLGGYGGWSGIRSPVFKNPFGDGMDGVWDAGITDSIGRTFSFGVFFT